MPTATDLVTDLPADFEVFGQAVATSMADLLGGTTGQVLSKTSNTDMDFTWVSQDDSNAIQNAIVDAKGDLIAASAADTPARLAVGTNGQVLTADSTAGTGLAWATPAAGGMTLLSTTTLSGSSTSINITPTGYTQLQIFINGAFTATNDMQVFMRVNGDTGSNYNYSVGRGDGAASMGNVSQAATTYFYYIFNTLPSTTSALNNGNAEITLWNPTGTGSHFVVWSSVSKANAGNTNNVQGSGTHNTGAAISSISFTPGSGNWSGGTVYVYGVK